MTGIIRMSLLILTAAVCGCGTAEQAPRREPNTTAGEISVAGVRESMLVSSSWLAGKLDDESVIVLHVATEADNYKTGHIPGAHYLGWDRLTETVDGVPNELPSLQALLELVRGLGIESGKRVVIYDEESGIRAARAYFTLDYLGLGENSSLLDGQLAVWRAEGRPLSTEEPSAVRSDFKPVINESIVAGMSELLASVDNSGPGRNLLDCRPPDQFSGEKPGRGIARGGHIPGAQNLPAMTLVVSEEKPLFLQPEQLRKLYERAGLNKLRPVVSYCRTGRSASLSYFTLKYLGYEARLYDGSFVEWQGTQSNPVETDQ